jgi:UDP-2-acetamido-2,6-beta-L-arabino-hexul-4-ose reductase
MAIVGGGDIAQALQEVDRPDRLFFASGVSNSQCTDEKEYKRERDLLLEQPTDAHLVYFSSLGVLWGNSRYYAHKRDMELMVQLNFRKHTIVRIGNITWGTNPTTLINYFKKELALNHKLVLKDETKYIIDKDEFTHWVNLIPDWPTIISITGRRMSVSDVVEEYCV